MKRRLLRIAAGIAVAILLLALLAVDFVNSFRRSVPDYDGTRGVAGLTAELQISRDAHAIPHIAAASFADAAFGLGYVHAQDRLWQMEISRRYIQGRLSEAFGADALATDSGMRALGLYRAATEALIHLKPETRRVLESYAGGVNAFLQDRSTHLPIEFTLAGITPEPWRPEDSIAVLKGMAAQLSGNAGSESARARLLPLLGRGGVQDFLTPFSAAPLPAWLDGIYGLTQVARGPGIPDISASNNWVVGGANSVTGKPLLANDPHLGFTLPSTWYLAHLALPGEDMAGGTLAGIPAIVAGRNRHVAWGLTNTEPDTQDLYLERLDPDNPNRYQTPAGFAEFETRIETIKVRFGADKQIRVRATRHGPVLEDAPGTAAEGATPRGYVLALAWTALAPDDTTIEAVIGINRAQNVEEFRTAANAFVTPMQNVVYADDSGGTGHIGLILPGRVPLRSDANDALGLVPAPGWDHAYDWQGYVPREAAFGIVDPPDGRIATANNKTVPDDYPYAITREWDAPYRHDRIAALLAATPHHSVDSFARIQLDPVDTYALILKSHLKRAAPFGAAEKPAADLLEAWNGAMLRGRPEPLIFAAYARALARRLYADELGVNFDDYWGYRPEFTLRALSNTEGEGRWCDDKTTPAAEDCPSRMRLALGDAVAELSAAYGPDAQMWRWGDPHVSVHSGRPFDAIPILGEAFRREIVMDGGAFTVLRADHRMGAQRPYAAVHGAGYRGIYDLADPDASLYIVSTGESGNLYSPHYDDLLRLWANGGYVKIPLSPQTIADSARYRLTLQPLIAVRLPNRPR
jgi:penicillin amidase